MVERESHVGDPERVEAVPWPRDRLLDGGHPPRGHLAEAALRDRRQERFPVREVPVRRGLGHVRTARDLAEAEALEALPRDERRGRLEQCVAEARGGAADILLRRAMRQLPTRSSARGAPGAISPRARPRRPLNRRGLTLLMVRK